MNRAVPIVAALLVCAGSGAEDPPKPVDLIETVQKKLVQFDVALEGPREQLQGLTADEFQVVVAGKTVTPFAVDALCGAAPSPSDVATATAETIAVPHAPTSYLFYFDQRNLTMGGRARSLDLAAEMVRRLVKGGNRGSIVSSGNRVVTFAPFTADVPRLVDALGRLRDDRSQWDEYATLEQSREDQAMTGAGWGESACFRARVYGREERARAEQSLDILKTVLGRFSGIDAPKLVVYFGDTLRDPPERHYIEIGGESCETSSDYAPLSFEALHADAAAYGVKIYAVQAEGLTAPSVSRPRAAQAIALSDAKSGLKALALDTGGNAFFDAAGIDTIVGKIEADASCVYLLSFDARTFDEDKPLPLSVKVKRPGVHARTRTHLVVQSESARRLSMLLAAFTAPDDLKGLSPLHAAILPLDVVGGKLRLLAQAALPVTELPQGEAWDIGMSLVAGTQVEHEASARIEVKEQGVPIVLESVMEVARGPFEISMVGMEAASGDIAAAKVAGAWDDLIDESRIVSIAVRQPAAGAFLRDGAASKSGALVVGNDDAVRSDLPIEFVSLVCKERRKQERAQIERSMDGAGVPPLGAMDLDFDKGMCAQVVDVVPANALAPGEFTYAIRVRGAGDGKTRTIRVGA